MDFTREPIVETVITPKEGCKIVVRSSKSVGQEEYFVDALEVVSFGNAIFFRSLEKPKAFLVPANDYEILEVREARMVLKNVGLDRSIKIGGGRESKKEPAEKSESLPLETMIASEETVPAENRVEKKRDRRRQQRRKRGRDETIKEEGIGSETKTSETPISQGSMNGDKSDSQLTQVPPSSFSSSLLPPPPQLISETINLYKEKFKNAFYTKEEAEHIQTQENIKGEDEITHSKGEDEITHSPDKMKEATQMAIDSEEPSPFATFWDDIAEPILPSISYIEGEERSQKQPPTEEPFIEEKND